MPEPFDLLEEIEREAEERDRRINRDDPESEFKGAQERLDPGLMRTIGAAFENENTFNVIGRTMERSRAANSGPTIDAEQVIKARPEYQKRLDLLPEEYREKVLEARTEAELDTILRHGETRVRNAEMLANGGLGQNLVSQLAVGLVDPVDWLVTITTGGAGKIATTANTARRVGIGALSAGVSNAAVEAVISSEDPTRTTTDIAAAAALGIGIGGALNLRGGPRERMSTDDTELDDALSRGAKDLLNGTRTPPLANRPANDDTILGPYIRPDAGSAGAAKREVEDVEYFGTQFLAPGAYGRLLDKSVPKEMRGFASQLLAGTSRVDDGVREITAEEVSSQIERTFRSRVYLDYNPHFESWRKEQGYNLVRADLTSGPQQDFMREVTRAMLGDTSVSKQARAAAPAFAKGYQRFLRRAQQAGVEGFEDIPTNANYVPRRINNRKYMQLRNEIGPEGVRIVLKNAMVKQGMDPALAERVAKAYETGTFDRATGRRQDTFVGPSEDSIERLRYYLPEDDPDLVDDVIAHLKQFRKEGSRDSGRIREARFRIDMDVMEPITINGREIRALDIFEDDASLLFERYARTVGGWIGLAERAGIKSQNDWDIQMDNLRQKFGNDPKNVERMQRLEEVKDLILGRSITSEGGKARRMAQAVMKLNFATSMGQAGMASIAEAGNIVAHMGLKNAMMHIPALRSFWRSARKGEVDTEFTDELRGLFGVGMRTKLSRGRAGYDEFADEIDVKMFDTIDRILDPASRATSYAGGIGPINDYLQLLASKSYLQKLANVATGRKKFSDADRARLRDAGFHDGVLDRAMENIRKHGVFDGKRLVGLGADKWEPDILNDLISATDRMVYRAVQENDIGSSAWWMHTTTGRMLTQFRSFIINAWVKQTLHGMRFRDRQTFAAVMFTTTFGGLSYMARSYTNTLTGDPERRERLLDPKNIATASMAATGYASIMPTVIDTGLVNIGEEAMFAQVRTTGLSTDLITGAPIVQTINNLQSTAGAPVRVMRDDYEFSQDDFRKFTRLLPLNNVLGVRNAIDLMNEELPERSKEDDYWK